MAAAGAEGDDSARSRFAQLRWRERCSEDELARVVAALTNAVKHVTSVARDHVVCLAGVHLDKALGRGDVHQCCTPCVTNALANSEWLHEDNDFVATNREQGFVCCGIGDEEGCLSGGAELTAVIQEVNGWAANKYAKSGKYPGPSLLRFKSYEAYIQQCLPGSPSAGQSGQIPLPLCVVARIRCSFPNPVDVTYKGRPT